MMPLNEFYTKELILKISCGLECFARTSHTVYFFKPAVSEPTNRALCNKNNCTKYLPSSKALGTFDMFAFKLSLITWPSRYNVKLQARKVVAISTSFRRFQSWEMNLHAERCSGNKTTVSKCAFFGRSCNTLKLFTNYARCFLFLMNHLPGFRSKNKNVMRLLTVLMLSIHSSHKQEKKICLVQFNECTAMYSLCNIVEFGSQQKLFS